MAHFPQAATLCEVTYDSEWYDIKDDRFLTPYRYSLLRNDPESKSDTVSLTLPSYTYYEYLRSLYDCRTTSYRGGYPRPNDQPPFVRSNTTNTWPAFGRESAFSEWGSRQAPKSEPRTKTAHQFPSVQLVQGTGESEDELDDYDLPPKSKEKLVWVDALNKWVPDTQIHPRPYMSFIGNAPVVEKLVRQLKEHPGDGAHSEHERQTAIPCDRFESHMAIKTSGSQTNRLRNEKQEAARRRAQEAEHRRYRKAHSSPLYTTLEERRQKMKQQISRIPASTPASPTHEDEEVPTLKEVWHDKGADSRNARGDRELTPIKREISINLLGTKDEELDDSPDGKDKKVKFKEKGTKGKKKDSDEPNASIQAARDKAAQEQEKLRQRSQNLARLHEQQQRENQQRLQALQQKQREQQEQRQQEQLRQKQQEQERKQQELLRQKQQELLRQKQQELLRQKQQEEKAAAANHYDASMSAAGKLQSVQKATVDSMVTKETTDNKDSKGSKDIHPTNIKTDNSGRITVKHRVHDNKSKEIEKKPEIKTTVNKKQEKVSKENPHHDRKHVPEKTIVADTVSDKKATRDMNKLTITGERTEKGEEQPVKLVTREDTFVKKKEDQSLKGSLLAGAKRRKGRGDGKSKTKTAKDPRRKKTDEPVKLVRENTIQDVKPSPPPAKPSVTPKPPRKEPQPKKVVKPVRTIPETVPPPPPKPAPKPMLVGMTKAKKPPTLWPVQKEEKLPVSSAADLLEEGDGQPKGRKPIVKKERKERICVSKKEVPQGLPPSPTVEVKPVDSWIFKESFTSDEAGSDTERIDTSVDLTPSALFDGLNPALIEAKKSDTRQKRKTNLTQMIASDGLQQKLLRRRGTKDSSYQDEMRRLELAEERRKKQMERVGKIKTRKAGQGAGQNEDGSPYFEDYGFLAKYCIFTKGNIEMYRHAFNAVDENKLGWMDGPDVMIALRGINNKLTEAEEMYLYRVLELTGYKVEHGADFKIFSVLAALSQRISSLDHWMKNIIGQMDFKALEMKLFMCKTLWECNVDPETNKISIDQVCVELRAGGVSMEHEMEVRDKLSHLQALDLLDFLTYVPLFIMIHESVVKNPLDDTRQK